MNDNDKTGSSGTVIVYVHGLWLNGWESIALRRRLARELDCRTLSFSYSSMRRGIAENVRSLAAFLEHLTADTVHLVGHSMGGILILETFEARPRVAPGRIVLLGSPVQGSQVARRLASSGPGNRILGPMAREVLLPEHTRRWNGARDLGVLAGNLPIGLGRLVCSTAEPSDGTVAESETYLEGARDRLVLRTTHSGMVYSSEIARQTAIFLRTGRFDGPSRLQLPPTHRVSSADR